MKNLMKLIVITAVTALLLCTVITCASADEKIYTSPVFKLPAEKLEDWAESQPDVPETEEEPEADDETADPQEETGEEATDESGETAEARREVKISTTQGKVVKKNEFITLSSRLIGIDKSEVTSYQWQVDRGDGLGWVDIEGANSDKYIYTATAETISYKWRLIVNVKD